jgi:hypothetical protein
VIVAILRSPKARMRFRYGGRGIGAQAADGGRAVECHCRSRYRSGMTGLNSIRRNGNMMPCASFRAVSVAASTPRGSAGPGQGRHR